MFASLLDRLEAAFKDSHDLADELINELGWFSRTPYDFTQALVALTLERLARSTTALNGLIGNRPAYRMLRFVAAQQTIAVRNESSYHGILMFIAELSRESSAETYMRLTAPLTDLYSRTGYAGLAVAVRVFEEQRLGPHGSLLLAAFKSEFATWFISHLPRPSVQWAEVLLKAWRHIDDATARNTMLRILVDEWASDSRVAQFVRRKLLQHLREDRRYLAPAGRHLQARVLEFATPGPGRAGVDFEMLVREDLDNGGAGLRTDRAAFPIDRTTGHVLARIYRESSDSTRNRVIEFLGLNSKRLGFQRSFYAELVKVRRFTELPLVRQLQIVQQPLLIVSVTTRELDRLLLISHQFDPSVVDALRDAMVAVLRRSGLSELDSSTWVSSNDH